MTGLTSNPTIFDHAIKNSTAYDAAIRSKLKAGQVGRGAVLRAGARGPHARRRPVPARSSSARAASTAGCRSRSRRCSRTTPRPRSPRRKELHARAGAAQSLHQDSRARTEGLPAIEEAIFAGVPINVTLLFSREHYLAAAEAYLRGIERRIAAGLDRRRRLGRVALHQPLGRRGRRQGAGGARPTGSASPIGQRTYKAYCDLVALAALAARDERRRAAAAAAVREHRHQGSEGVRHPVRQGAGRAVHRQHDARRHAARRSPTTARSARRCRPTAATARRCWREFAQAGIDIDALAAQLQDEGAASFVKSWNELMARDRVQERALKAAERDGRERMPSAKRRRRP